MVLNTITALRQIQAIPEPSGILVLQVREAMRSGVLSAQNAGPDEDFELPDLSLEL